ncbi:MAG TPA: hypothetical protein VM936_07745 [Pyrinomonadaceae bacterium]|jgi:hypothetical protein|nr:hypothetical protein [Pyrinomonadaceae bacterium]
MTQGAGGGRRSRIVIDVASAREQARNKKGLRAGRAGRFLSPTALVVVGVLLVLLVSAYAWWRGFERSPAYSLALLVDAAQRDDKQAVESLINADTIAEGFIPQVVEKLAGQGSQLTPQARASLPSVIPQLIPRVRETMRDEIARNLKELRGGDTSSTPFFVKALGVRGLTDVREQGDTAAVAVKSDARALDLTMKRDGDRWRVVNVKDDRLATDIAARLATSIPSGAPAPPQPQPRRKGR